MNLLRHVVIGATKGGFTQLISALELIFLDLHLMLRLVLLPTVKVNAKRMLLLQARWRPRVGLFIGIL